MAVRSESPAPGWRERTSGTKAHAAPARRPLEARRTLHRLVSLSALALLLLGTQAPAASAGCISSPGRPPVPLETFVLPSPAPGNGAYHPDLQASFPAVDWQTLDRLYLPAGHYKFLYLGNLPERDACRPLVITNHGGQVRVGALDHHYLFILGGGSNWQVTGRYNPLAETGDATYTGHAGGRYANSRGTYGIVVDDEFVRDSVSGIAVGGGATDFEIDFVEITRVGFAGMLVKTDDDGDATMRNVRIHDNYIHDTGSEGVYFGSTQAPPQHSFENLQFYNNRVLRSGTELVQMGQLGAGSEIHHNVFLVGDTEWKNPFQAFQDNGGQFGVRYGNVSFHHNVLIGGASNFFQFFPQFRDGDPHGTAGETDLVDFHNNYFSHSRSIGIYFHNFDVPSTRYRFRDNWFRAINYSYDELDPDHNDRNAIFVHFNRDVPIELLDNRWSGPQVLAPGAQSNVTVAGNENLNEIPPFGFVNSGFLPDFDYHLIETWTDLTLHGDPVFYDPGDYAMLDGALYLNVEAGSHTNKRPDLFPETWELQPAPADDVRTLDPAAFPGIGLLDSGDLLFGSGFENGSTDEWSG